MTWRENLQKLREFNRNGLLVQRVEGRFSFTKTGYRFDRYLIRIALALSMAIILGMFAYGVHQGVRLNELYVDCPFDTPYPGCLNPYYMTCDEDFCRDIVGIKTFQPGTTFGEPPNEAFLHASKWATILGIAVFVGALLLNHFRYNKGEGADRRRGER